MEAVIVVIREWCKVDALMFDGGLKRAAFNSYIYKVSSYFLPLSYIIFRSMLVLDEAGQCPHSALTPHVQRYDFIQSEHEGQLSFPQFYDPEMASTGCGAHPTHDRLRSFGRT